MFTYAGRRHSLTPLLATAEISLLWRHKVTFRDAIGNREATLTYARGKIAV